MSSLPTLGLDIAKLKLDAALLTEHGVMHQVFANTADGYQQLQTWYQQFGLRHVHACLEATGPYGDGVALALHAAGQTVSLINPARLKAFAQTTMTRTKTDKTDAVLLARFCAAFRPAPWTPPPLELRELQALVRRWVALQQMRQQDLNRRTGGLAHPAVYASMDALRAHFDQALAQVEQALHDHLRQHPTLQRQVQLLDSIPGIAWHSAVQLLAEIGAWSNYASARALAAQAGLTPKQRLSGSSVHGKPKLAKTGSARLRKLLYFPAIVARTHNPIIRAFCDRLAAQGKPKMVIVGAAMRKLLHLIYGVLKSGQPFDPDYRASARKTA
jgi:transposase